MVVSYDMNFSKLKEMGVHLGGAFGRGSNTKIYKYFLMKTSKILDINHHASERYGLDVTLIALFNVDLMIRLWISLVETLPSHHSFHIRFSEGGPPRWERKSGSHRSSEGAFTKFSHTR